jgi:hypothetical protein
MITPNTTDVNKSSRPLPDKCTGADGERINLRNMKYPQTNAITYANAYQRISIPKTENATGEIGLITIAIK